jgi:ankyrin repeat protein
LSDCNNIFHFDAAASQRQESSDHVQRIDDSETLELTLRPASKALLHCQIPQFRNDTYWEPLMSKNANRQPRQRNTTDSAYSVALQLAAFRGQAERVLELIAAGADVGETDSDGDTPLMLAAAHGHANIAAMLLRSGADVNVHNDRGETALHQAAYAGHVDAVKALLAAGAPVNARDYGGSTALICAAFRGHADVAAALLAAGADVKIRNRSGHGALDLAAHNGLDLSGKLLRFEQRS